MLRPPLPGYSNFQITNKSNMYRVSQDATGRSRSRSRQRRSRSRSRSAQGAGGGRNPRYAPLRNGVVTRKLTRGVHEFEITSNPFSICLTSGNTGAVYGAKYYVDGQIPSAGYTGTSYNDWALNFQLLGTAVYQNSAYVATAVNSNYTDYTGLFDDYKIDWIEVQMLYNSNSSAVNSAVNLNLPTVHMVKDYDDSDTSGLASMQQYDSYQVLQFGNSSGSQNGMQVIRIKPRFQAVVQTLAGTAVGLDMSQQFLDCNQPQIPHYGLKFLYDNQNTGANAPVGFITFYVKYHFKCRGTR